MKIEPIALSVNEAAKAIGVSRWKIYELAGGGQLDTCKLGGRTLIPTASLRRLIERNTLRAE